MEQGIIVMHNTVANDQDDDVFILYDKSPLITTGFSSSNPILVDDYFSQDPIFCGSKRVFDLTRDDDDDVQILDYKPRKKLLKGESSNSNTDSKPNAIEDSGFFVVDDDSVVVRTFLCEICVDEKPMSEVFCITGCDHSFCSDCVAKYIASKLQENITHIACPISGCVGKLDPHNCFSILPRQVFDRWGDALCEALILASEKMYCPYKDCSSLLINDSNIVTVETECPDCHRLFCARCNVPWHSEVSCEEYEKLDVNERTREDILLKKLVQEQKWMRCPKCRIFVQRSEGCLFMMCRCRCTFCYNCGAETNDHYCNSCKH